MGKLCFRGRPCARVSFGTWLGNRLLRPSGIVFNLLRGQEQVRRPALATPEQSQPVFDWRRAPFLSLALVCCSLASGVAAWQSRKPETPNAKKSNKPTHPAFTCPDPLAAESCKSFKELYEAGDEGVTLYALQGYACFRQNEDQFFVLTLNRPSFRMHYDRDSKSIVPDDDGTASGIGFISGYSKGVRDTSIMPIYKFTGDWTPFGPRLTATKINGEDIPDPTHNGLWVDAEQINAVWRFKNRFDKDVGYQLSIQRSTGRFTETYTENPSKVPFVEEHGRCSHLPPPPPD